MSINQANSINPNPVPMASSMVAMQNQSASSPAGVQMGGPVGTNLPGVNLMPVGNSINNQPSQPPNSHSSSNQNQPAHLTPAQYDLSRLKSLLNSLRDNLNILIIVASSNINYSHVDNARNLEQPQRFDKALEDFFAVCNQLELCLRTILECAIQARDNHNYLQFQVSKDFQIESQPNMPDNSKSYTQYLNIIKKQVNYAKAVYDILSETVKQVKQTDIVTMPAQQQPQPQQPPIHPTAGQLTTQQLQQ